MASLITSAAAPVLVILGVVCVILALLSGGMRRGYTEPSPMASTARAIFGLFGVILAALGIGLFWTFTPNLPGHPPTPTAVWPTPTQVAVVPSATPTQMHVATPTPTLPAPTVAPPTSTPVSPTTTVPSPTPTTAPSPTPSPTPCTIIHIVEAGETLSGIAANYGITVEAIVQASNIANPSLIYVGQQLVISVCGTPMPTPSPSPPGPTPTATPRPTYTPVSPCMYPKAEITAPHEGDRRKKEEKVIVWGTATHMDFQFYEIEYISPDGALISVEGSHYGQVTDGQLAVWDTTQLSEGIYTLRIKVVDNTGNFLSCDVRVFIEQ